MSTPRGSGTVLACLWCLAPVLSLAGAAGVADLGDASALLQSAVFDPVLALEPVMLASESYIHFPKPASLEEMRRIKPRAKGMVLYNFSGGVLIYGYKTEEDQSISQTLSKGRMWEAGNSAKFCRFLQSLAYRADFLDVGANIGTFSIPIAHCLRRMGLGGKVIAVEGMKSIAEHLEASVVKNNMSDMIDVFNYAVGDASVRVGGKVTEAPDEVTMMEDVINKGASSIVTARKTSVQRTTSLTTLNSILGSRQYKIAAMKMDIEGYEGQALKGASALLKMPPCMLSIELSRAWLGKSGTPVEEVVDMLSKAGFEVPPTKTIQGLFSTVIYQRDMKTCVKRFGGTWPLPH